VIGIETEIIYFIFPELKQVQMIPFFHPRQPCVTILGQYSGEMVQEENGFADY
jgi:hypothetical protein